MKTTPVLLLLLSLGLSTNSQAHLCVNGSPFSQPSASHEAAWRSALTHARGNGDFAATSPAREGEIKRVRQNMEDEILGVGKFANAHPDTPPIEFISAEGVAETYATHSNGENGQLTVIKVGKVEAGAQAGEGHLNGTLLLPASGHTGAANARQYALKDTYTIRYQISLDAQGTKFASYDGSAGAALVQDAASVALVTAHESTIPLVKDHVTRIYYFRSDSGGPRGYFDGRVIDFVWDGSTL